MGVHELTPPPPSAGLASRTTTGGRPSPACSQESISEGIPQLGRKGQPPIPHFTSADFDGNLIGLESSLTKLRRANTILKPDEKRRIPRRLGGGAP